MDLHASVSGFLLSTGLILVLGLMVTFIATATAQRGHAWLGRRVSPADGQARLDLLALGGTLSPGRRPALGFASRLQATAITDGAGLPRVQSPADVTGANASATASERRNQKRYRTCFLGTLHAAASDRATNLCDILDLSATGARIRPVEPLPALMSEVTVGLERLGRFPARVVWRAHGEVGLRFELSPEQVLTKMCGLIPRPENAAPITAQPAH